MSIATTTSPSPPSFPGILQVTKAPGAFASSLKFLRSFSVGDTICSIEGVTRCSKAYSSVQVGPDLERDHIELNSDLLYCNHSCEPSVKFDVSSQKHKDWKLTALKHVKAGDAVTFFYPSTEFIMAQPFDCNCASQNCLGAISGAKDMSVGVLNAYWLAPHIVELKKAQIESSNNVETNFV